MLNRWLALLRLRLADSEAILPYSLLGIVSGAFCALIMVAFRWLIETPGELWLPNSNYDNFESLPRYMHFLLPVAGAILLGLILKLLPSKDIRTGIPHVISRVHGHHGHMPIKNALVQFFGGAFALITGQSGGREGPVIHLGAAGNAIMGQFLRLPNNSVRVLAGCGSAAAVAASFNTPIAGVILAMEVIMMEYTVAGFLPILLSAVVATAISRSVFGNEALLELPALEMASLLELPYIAFLGFAAGCATAVFIVILKYCSRHADAPIFNRLCIAGLVTGSLALIAPEILGIGYDTINDVLSNNIGVTALLIIIITKIIASAISCGLGMPIGLIGPTLVIGACLGAALGGLGVSIAPEYSSNQALYVLLGMGAMMGAVLNAPLAALMALLELSQNPAIIFPGMLAITLATITNTEIFKQRSAHQTVLDEMREILRTDPMSLALQRTSVNKVLSTSIHCTERRINETQTEELQKHNARWILIQEEQRYYCIEQSDLSKSLQAADISSTEQQKIDILAIADPIVELPLLHSRATLAQALRMMEDKDIDQLCVFDTIKHSNIKIVGVIHRNDIEAFLHIPIGGPARFR